MVQKQLDSPIPEDNTGSSTSRGMTTKILRLEKLYQLTVHPVKCCFAARYADLTGETLNNYQ